MHDNKAVVVVVALADDPGDAQPVGRAHVGAVDVHGLHDVELVEAFDLGHAACEFLTRESGGEPVAVLGRCDGTAGCDEEDAFHGDSRSIGCKAYGNYCSHSGSVRLRLELDKML